MQNSDDSSQDADKKSTTIENIEKKLNSVGAKITRQKA